MIVELDIDLEKFRWSLVGDGYIREEVITMMPDDLIDIFTQRVMDNIDKEYRKSLRCGLIDKDEAITFADIYNEFKANYPDFVDDVLTWKAQYMGEGEMCRNIWLRMKNGCTKRYSYDTKKLYPVYL